MKAKKLAGAFAVAGATTAVITPVVAAPAAHAAAAPSLQTSITMSASIPEIGTKINVDKGLWSGTGVSYTYQWEFRAPGTSTWVQFRKGAIVTGVIPTASQLGGHIRVAVIASDANGTTTSYGPIVGPVRYPAPINVWAPTIEGGASGANPGPTVFIASHSAWSGYTGAVVNMWQRSYDYGLTWVDTGVTTDVYTPTAADNDTFLRVSSTCSNASLSTTVYSNMIQPQTIQKMSGSLALNGVRGSAVSTTTPLPGGGGSKTVTHYEDLISVDKSNLSLEGITLNDTFWSWVVTRNGVEVYRTPFEFGFDFTGSIDTGLVNSPDLVSGDIVTVEVVSTYGPKIISSPYVISEVEQTAAF